MEQQRDPWELEHEDEAPKPDFAKLEFKPKAHLVLEGSEQFEWGLVKDCHGRINMIPDDAEVVGSWNKYGEGTYWVDLMMPLEALQDRATQLFKELSGSRESAMAQMGFAVPVKRTPRAKREPKAAEEPKPKDDTFDKLRSMLKG